MKHIGIDLGSRQSAMCTTEGGNVLSERTLKTVDLGRWFAKSEPCRVVLESCAESRRIALLAQAAGHEVRIVPSMFVRSLGVGARKIKTDKRDARALADASFRMGEKLPSIHIRSDASVALQDLLNSRQSVIATRTKAINTVRGYMRKELLERVKGDSTLFAARVREALGDMAENELAISVHLAIIDTANEQLAKIETRLKQLADSNEEAQRLRKLPGVGPIIALAFIAAIDDAKRFPSAEKVASFAGLCPGENTTGGNRKRIGIIGAGKTWLRSLLVQGAHSALNSQQRDPLLLWARGLEQRKGRKVAVCALARKLAVIMWAMLRDGSRYDPRMNRPRATALEERTEQLRSELSSAVLEDAAQLDGGSQPTT